jgi:Leucine-rich repeat (LRR) protein
VFLEATDKELGILCQSNKLFHDICLDDYFWKIRGAKYISSDDFQALKLLSGKNNRDTYILFRTLEKLKNGILTNLNKNELELFQLQYLNLSFREIKSIPTELGTLAALQTLDLSYNLITSVPKELGNLTQLRTLNLSGNRISSLPKELGNFTELQILNLFDNELRVIPKELGKLTQLKFLYLFGNPTLSSIPKEVENLTELQIFR